MNNSIEEILTPSTPKKNQEIKKLNIIKKLKEYEKQEKITNLLQEFNKKQEDDYFLTQNNIKIGKFSPEKKNFYDSNNNLIPYSYVGPSSLFNTSISKKATNIRTNSILKYKSNASSSKNKESLHINKNIIIDNKYLKNHFNEIRKRISEIKLQKSEKNRLLFEVPFGVRRSLINQENNFIKLIKEKKLEKKLQEKIRGKCNKKDINELLINKNQFFDKKNQNYTIIDKNITLENRYRDNLWNITLRNLPINGKYEKVGYLNVGNNYHPMYTFFNMNKTIEFFSNPRYERNKTEDNKNNKILSNLKEDFYNLKVKNNLNVLNLIKSLEINGKNLLDLEDKRESEIKGKKIIYKKQDLDSMYLRQNEKSKNGKEIGDIMTKTSLDRIYQRKTFAKNYKKIDFYKNANLTSKYSNDLL